MSPMNELVRDLALKNVPTKFDRNRRRIASGKVLTGLCLQTDRRTISFQYTPLSTSLSRGIKMSFICVFNLLGAEARILQNWVNIMAADALDPCVARPSAVMVLTVLDNWFSVFHEEGFETHVPIWCWEIIENAFFCFYKKHSMHVKGHYISVCIFIGIFLSS